jgi:hypothetical protein
LERVPDTKITDLEKLLPQNWVMEKKTKVNATS